LLPQEDGPAQNENYAKYLCEGHVAGWIGVEGNDRELTRTIRNSPLFDGHNWNGAVQPTTTSTLEYGSMGTAARPQFPQTPERTNTRLPWLDVPIGWRHWDARERRRIRWGDRTRRLAVVGVG
jgi:hypothetical protein